MSLYIGSDTNTAPILHLTSGVESEAFMRSSEPIGSTVFHSSLSYIRYDRYECNISYATKQYTFPLGSLVVTNTVNGTLIDLPIAAVQDIVTNDKIFIVGTRNNVNDSMNLTHPPVSLAHPAVVYYNAAGTAYSYTLSTTYYRLFVDTQTIAYADLFVLSSNTDGYIPPVFDSSAGILIENGSINIKGVDILSLGYISSETVNSEDLLGSVSGTTIQFVNSVDNSSTKLSIISDPFYTILKGSKPIFGGNLSTGAKMFHTYSDKVTVSGRSIGANSTVDVPLKSGIDEGSLLLVAMSTQGIKTLANGIVCYNNNYVFIFGTVIGLKSFQEHVVYNNNTVYYRFKNTTQATVNVTDRAVTLLALEN